MTRTSAISAFWLFCFLIAVITSVMSLYGQQVSYRTGGVTQNRAVIVQLLSETPVNRTTSDFEYRVRVRLDRTQPFNPHWIVVPLGQN